MTQWFYAINRREAGPVSEMELTELVRGGAIRPTDLVWQEGTPDWVPAASCPFLFPEARFSERRDDPPRRRRYVDESEEDWPHRRLPQRGSGWIVAMCVVVGLLLITTVSVVVYFALENQRPRVRVAANAVGNDPIDLGGNQGAWSGELTMFDAEDPKAAPLRKPGCVCKRYTYQMFAGTTYVIDLESDDFDGYLRLEDASGKTVAEDDDGGPVHPDSRIIYRAEATGKHTIIVTTFEPGQRGTYTLKVAP